MGTALIVEDHPDQAEMVAKLLRLRNYEPIVADTGETGLEMARRHDPDVVVLDLMLPDISGFDVCRRLRSEPATMLTPVVMLTALGDADNRRHGFRVGANAYVTKPYGIQDLLDAIAAARAWRAEMDQGALQGEIHVELNSEITLLQDLNDFLMNVCRSTPFTNEQVMQSAAGGPGAVAERHRVGQPAPVGPPGQHHLPRLRGPHRDHHPRPGERVRHQQPAARRGRRRPVLAPRRARQAGPPRGGLRPHDLQGDGR